jgi:3-hydroxyisobutyrate dehydrogenase
MSADPITILGAGRMGTAIAGQLAAAGVDVRIWNRTPQRATALAAERIQPFASLPDAVRGASVVISILSDGRAVRETLGAAAEALDPGAVVVEASTIDPATMAEVAGRVPVPVLSCAVSGTPAVVSRGSAAVLVSGPEEARSRAAASLQLFAAHVVEVGNRVEDAKLVKIGLNAVLAGTMELLAESTVMLEAGGVGRATFADALAGSVLASTYTGYKLKALCDRDYTPTFATRDLRKDVALAVSEAARNNIDLPFARRLVDLLDETIDRGWGDLDFLALVPRLQAANNQAGDLES